jgi:hypothetical protein
MRAGERTQRTKLKGNEIFIGRKIEIYRDRERV